MISTAGGVTSAGSSLAEWKLLDSLAKKADSLFQEQNGRTMNIAMKLHKMECMINNVLRKKKKSLKEGATVALAVGSVVWNVGSLTYTTVRTTLTVTQGIIAGAAGAAAGGKLALNAGVPVLGAASTASRGGYHETILFFVL